MGGGSASTRGGQWAEDGGDVGERLRRRQWCGCRRRDVKGKLDFSASPPLISGSQGRRSMASVRGESKAELAPYYIPFLQKAHRSSSIPEKALCVGFLEAHKPDMRPSHRSAAVDIWSDTLPHSTVKTEKALVPRWTSSILVFGVRLSSV
ncbi:hypothetical protein BKA70DRAFT_174761 [Coprinopsis sp. MPI-PUGE-AT-0042]|nr:hypothetical protein BKA70DRAFT_174761 [Coprinopsis sp. MPI-PUGE-AT-0042]